jgi:hypothetical protein
MAKVRSDGQRLIALLLGVLLITGGIAGVSVAGALLASKIGAFIAIGAGLVFLGIAARKQRNNKV